MNQVMPAPPPAAAAAIAVGAGATVGAGAGADRTCAAVAAAAAGAARGELVAAGGDPGIALVAVPALATTAAAGADPARDRDGGRLEHQQAAGAAATPTATEGAGASPDPALAAAAVADDLPADHQLVAGHQLQAAAGAAAPATRPAAAHGKTAAAAAAQRGRLLHGGRDPGGPAVALRRAAAPARDLAADRADGRVAEGATATAEPTAAAGGAGAVLSARSRLQRARAGVDAAGNDEGAERDDQPWLRATHHDLAGDPDRQVDHDPGLDRRAERLGQLHGGQVDQHAIVAGGAGVGVELEPVVDGERPERGRQRARIEAGRRERQRRVRAGWRGVGQRAAAVARAGRVDPSRLAAVTGRIGAARRIEGAGRRQHDQHGPGQRRRGHAAVSLSAARSGS
jgi:hypothetical protein